MGPWSELDLLPYISAPTSFPKRLQSVFPGRRRVVQDTCGKKEEEGFGFGEGEKPAKIFFFLEKESFEPTDREMFSRLFFNTKAFLGSVSKSVLKISCKHAVRIITFELA